MLHESPVIISCLRGVLHVLLEFVVNLHILVSLFRHVLWSRVAIELIVLDCGKVDVVENSSTCLWLEAWGSIGQPEW